MTTDLSWAEVEALADRLVDRVLERGTPDNVWGVPQGGIPVAAMVARRLNVPHLLDNEHLSPRTLIVDDLVDSGATADRFSYSGWFEALLCKPHSPERLVAPGTPVMDGWVTFPWEKASGPEDAVLRLLEHIGEDPTRDGLLDTPKRVVKALREMTSGYLIEPKDLLATTFDVSYDEMVVVRRIPFVSLCEHHMLPFVGHATVAYIPGKVVGLSKLARLVDAFGRRLQVQERLTNQIADAIEASLEPVGVGVIVTAQHACMSARGIQKHADMVTSALRGALKDEPAARHELLTLHQG